MELGLEKMLDLMPSAIILFEEKFPYRLVYANHAYFSFLEYTKEEYYALENHTTLDDAFEEDRKLLYDTMDEAFNAGERYSGEYRAVTKNGITKWVMSNANCFENNGKSYVAMVTTDIIEKHRLQIEHEEQLQEKIRKDLATDLYNRRSTENMINQYLEKIKIFEKEEAIMVVIDIDNFKQINDTKGHIFGDKVIETLADSIKHIVSKESIIGRVGGDEFVVFYKEPIYREEIVQQIQEILTIFEKKEKMDAITFSIGVSTAPRHGLDYVELFSKADEAMYLAKEKGKNQYVIV